MVHWWAGHLARAPADGLDAIALRWCDLSSWLRRAEGPIANVLGPDWLAATAVEHEPDQDGDVRDVGEDDDDDQEEEEGHEECR